MIHFMNLQDQYFLMQNEIDSAIRGVLESGKYVLGENVERFEDEFACYCGAKFGIGLASGTDAVFLSLKAYDIKEGDEVITAPNTAIATISAINLSGATPIFVDVKPSTYTIDVSKIEDAITPKTKAIIPVHLYGHPADLDNITGIAKRNNLIVIEDACQAHGAEYKNRKVGSIGDVGCFSFYPTKNLGCFGDGGMVITNNAGIKDKLKLLRNYGSSRRDLHEIKGVNSRLDEIQAAVLRVKLTMLDEWNKQRSYIAYKYNQLLRKTDVLLPSEHEYGYHVYHQYVIRTEFRDLLKGYLTSQNIQTLIHYPLPIYRQPVYKYLGVNPTLFPNTEKVVNEILSLPIYPGLRDEDIESIAEAIMAFTNR